jgi:hypothetical protein
LRIPTQRHNHALQRTAEGGSAYALVSVLES